MSGALLCSLLLFTINLFAFASFGFDKQRARRGAHRIPERSLLFLALIGGIGGAWVGRQYFRHKIRKAGFSAILALITLAQMAFIVWFFTCT